jgi:hypothetical protein
VLMMNQRRRQYFGWELEKFERERAGHDGRILDEIWHFLKQAGLGADRVADASLQPLRFGVELARDLVVTLAALEDDEIFEQARGYSSNDRTLIARPARPLVVKKRWP